MQVNIYIETTWRGPRHMPGTYEFVMEAYVSDDKDPVTLTKATYADDSTENTAYVMAAAEAVNRLNTKCDVCFYTPNRFFNAAVNEYFPKWRQNGFTTSKKEPVANALLWQQIAERAAEVSATDVSHQYRNCMKSDVRRLNTEYSAKRGRQKK